MSAYVVSIEEVRFLVAAAQLWELYWFHNDTSHRIHCVDDEAAAKAGQMLWSENVRSFDYRYSETTPDNVYVYGKHNVAWGFKISGPKLALQVLRVLATYEYQACETEDWATTESHEFCRMLRHEAIRHLPGWGEADVDFSCLSDNPWKVAAPVGGAS